MPSRAAVSYGFQDNMFALRSISKVTRVNAVRPLNIRYNIAAMSSISEAIEKDHRELEQYYNEVVNNPGNHDYQQRYGNQFTWELARHSVAEELVVYPAFELYLGVVGKDMAESDRREHHEVSH